MFKTNKQPYISPRALLAAVIPLEPSLVIGPSVVDHMESVKASGQELKTYDFSEESFQHEWGN